LVIIGIAGGSGSGKTTFAHKVLNKSREEIAMLSLDSYYLPLELMPTEYFTSSGSPNFDHPSAFDWELLKTHLQLLKNGESISVPIYDFRTNSRTEETTCLSPAPVMLFEGIFSLFDETIRGLLDIKVYLHVEADIRFTRRLDRDLKERGRTVSSTIQQYYETVRPMYKQFLEPQRQFADFIVGEETDVGASILAAKINEVFTEATLAEKYVN